MQECTGDSQRTSSATPSLNHDPYPTFEPFYENSHFPSRVHHELLREHLAHIGLVHVTPAMSTQPEGRPSMDRWRADSSYSNRGPHRQQPFDAKDQDTLSTNKSYNAVGPPRNRYAGSGVGDEQLSNGNLSDSSVGGRHGRDRDRSTTQNMPIRERSRTNGNLGPKRVCGKCGEPLLGQFVRAMGGMFHLECFMCRVSHAEH